MAEKVNNVVLVHGGFVDGSGWRGVYDILRRDGFNVSVVQNPTASLTGDVAATKLVLDEQPDPVILVGHSYGGAVITEAGTHPKVAGLVYITAFAPDAGESVSSLIANPPPGAPVPPILPPKDGYLFLDKAKFARAFAADVDAATAEFLANSQVPWGVDALAGRVTDPAWKRKPSWYLHVTDDRMIPIAAQRFMSERARSTTTEVPGSHAIYVSNPGAAATLIETAARSAMLAATPKETTRSAAEHR
jgi:pimeloyl-ACP methyl ester carboxylesterase